MVTVTNYQTRTTKDGREFITLELQGGLEMVVSKTSGQYYATTKKCNIPTTFNDQVANRLIGTELEGEIVRQEVEPYEFVNPRNNETMMLNYSWVYKLTPDSEPIGITKVQAQEEALTIEKVKK